MKHFRLFLLLLSIAIFHPQFISSSTEKGGGVFWKISGNGLQQASYLLGTTHSMHYDYVRDSIPFAWEAFHSVRQFIPEMSYYEQMMYSYNHRSKLSSVNDAPPQIYDYKKCLSEEDFNLLDSVFHTVPFWGQESLSVVKPNPGRLKSFIAGPLRKRFEETLDRTSSDWYFINFFSSPFGSLSMDFFLTKMAEKKNYAVHSLDEMDYFSKLKKSPEKTSRKITVCDEIKVVSDWVKEWVTTGYPDYVDPIKVYMKQNIDSIEYFQNTKTKSVSRTEGEESIAYGYMEGRNHLWMKKLPALMKNQSSFIAVGVGHLCGKDGLISLLREEGYTVEPVTGVEPIDNKKVKYEGIQCVRDSLIKEKLDKLQQQKYDKEWSEDFRFILYNSVKWIGNRYTREKLALFDKIPIGSRNDWVEEERELKEPSLFEGDTIKGGLMDLDGNTHNLSDITNGKYALIHFWGKSDKEPNRQGKLIELINKRYKDKFVLININTDKEKDDWEKIPKTEQSVKNEFHANIVPYLMKYDDDTYCFVNPDGEVIGFLSDSDFDAINIYFRQNK